MGTVYCLLSSICIVDAPRPPITLETTDKEEGEEAIEHQQGLRLSELELLVTRNPAVVSSTEVFYTMLWCACLLLCGVAVATLSISDKATTTSITRGVGVILRSEWVHLCCQSGSIPGQSIVWSE